MVIINGEEVFLLLFYGIIQYKTVFKEYSDILCSGAVGWWHGWDGWCPSIGVNSHCPDAKFTGIKNFSFYNGD